MLTTLIKFVVTNGIISSFLNIMYHKEMNYSKKQQFFCSEFLLPYAIVKFYEVIPIYEY